MISHYMVYILYTHVCMYIHMHTYNCTQLITAHLWSGLACEDDSRNKY